MSFPTGGDVNDVMYVWLVISNRTFSTLRRLLLESFQFLPHNPDLVETGDDD